MNSFFGLGPMELLVIVFLALIVLGPQRLPGTIREVMKWWRYFRNLSSELTSQLGEEFKDLEDLSPQKILEDLAKELDTEVEQTKEAASLKKKTPPKSKETKPAASKATAEKPVEAETSTTTEAPVAIAESTAATTLATAAQSSVSDAHKPETIEQDVEESEVDESEAGGSEAVESATPVTAEAPAKVSSPDESVDALASDEAAIVVPVEDAAEHTGQAFETVGEAAPGPVTENTILPPSDTTDAVLDITSSVDGAAGAQPPAEEPLSEPTASSTDDDVVEPTNGQEEPLAKKPIERAEPAPVSVNGKGAHPEDEA